MGLRILVQGRCGARRKGSKLNAHVCAMVAGSRSVDAKNPPGGGFVAGYQECGRRRAFWGEGHAILAYLRRSWFQLRNYLFGVENMTSEIHRSAQCPVVTVDARDLQASLRAFHLDKAWFASHVGRRYRLRRLWRHEAFPSGGDEAVGTHAVVVFKEPWREMRIVPFVLKGTNPGAESFWCESEFYQDGWRDEGLFLAVDALDDITSDILLSNLAFELVVAWRPLSSAEIADCIKGPRTIWHGVAALFDAADFLAKKHAREAA